MDDIKNLKKRKKALGLTTAKLAYLAELPVGTVSKIMTGETRNPSYLTIEKLDNVLTHEEMIFRINAYREYLTRYLKEHGAEDFDQKLVEKKYRQEHNLSNAPIPFAVPKKENDDIGNLAIAKDMRLDISFFHEIGEDKLLEIIDGKLIINEAPSLKHQMLVQNVGKVIDRFIDGNKGSCRMFNVGVNVYPDEDNYSALIPDIVVICDPDRIKDDGIYGSPDWIIEITSPSTRHRDYNEKMHKYMGSGVREYWIVDLEKEKVTTYIEGEPMMAYIYSFDDDIPVYIYEGKLKLNIRNCL